MSNAVPADSVGGPVASSATPIRAQWLLVVGIVLLGANLRASITSLGPVLEQVRSTVSLSATAAGWLNALPLITFSLLSPVAPFITRRLGMERTLGLSLGVLVMGILLRSAPGSLSLWAGMLLLGAAIAVCNVVLPSLVKRDFGPRAPTVISLYAGTMGVVASIASGTIVLLAGASATGWRAGLAYWAVPAVVALVVWLPQLRSRTLPVAATAAKPYRSPWTSPLGWQVALFMGLHSTVFYTLIDWFPAYAGTHGIDAKAAGFDLFVYQFVAVAANLSMAFAMPRVKDQRLLGFACSVLILIGVSGLMAAPALAVLWLVFAGLGARMALVVCLSLFNLRTEGHAQAASLSGMAQCVGYLLAACGPVAVGTLSQVTGGWTVPFAILVGFASLQTVVAVLAGRNRLIG